MSQLADKWPNGVPHAVGAVIVQALRDCTELAGALVHDNPPTAALLSEGARIVFFEDQADRARDGVQKRTYEFAIGVISRAADARTAAHADYRTARRVLRQVCMPSLTKAGLLLESRGVTEGEVRYRLENIDVGGSLVIGSFSIDYRDPLLI